MRSDPPEEVDVLVRVEAGHVMLRGHVRLENLHVLVQVVVEDEAAGAKFNMKRFVLGFSLKNHLRDSLHYENVQNLV